MGANASIGSERHVVKKRTEMVNMKQRASLDGCVKCGIHTTIEKKIIIEVTPQIRLSQYPFLTCDFMQLV